MSHAKGVEWSDLCIKITDHLIDKVGVGWTCGILIAAIVIVGGFIIYRDQRKEHYTDQLVLEKEKAVQRSAKEAREYKIGFFKDKMNWTDEMVDKYILESAQNDPVSSREAVQESGRKHRAKKQKSAKEAPAS